MKEYKDIIKGFKNLNEGYEEEIHKIKNELKKQPEVISIPQIKSVAALEAKLMNDLKQKEQLIGIVKAQFGQNCREEYRKHEDEIEEYKIKS